MLSQKQFRKPLGRESTQDAKSKSEHWIPQAGAGVGGMGVRMGLRDGAETGGHCEEERGRPALYKERK